MKKKIIFINPHWNHLLMNTMMYYLFKIKAPTKYAIFFNELIKREDIEIVAYITPKGSIIPTDIHIPFKRFLAQKECKYIFRKNGFTNKIKFIDSPDMATENDVVIGFIHTKGGVDNLSSFKCKKILHLNQFQCHPLKELKEILPCADEYILEANVFKDNNYIMKALEHIKNKKIHILPFIVSNRFTMIIPFKKRKIKAVATGTLARFTEKENDYIKHYGTPYFHKMRKIIYDNRSKLEKFIDCYISPYLEEKSVIYYSNWPQPFKSIGKFYYLLHSKPGQQKNYFSFDIVEKYNEYQMAIVPEEIAGCPAIGAFEAMACGCAFIGIDHSMYKDIGLIPGIHYISYNGTLEDLIKKIDYYQSHQDELEKIANNGKVFINTHTRSSIIINQFIDIINGISAKSTES